MTFCEGCEYHDWTCAEYGAIHWCTHPKNSEVYHNEIHEWTRQPDCDEVNKRNDCKLWEAKLTLWERIKKYFKQEGVK